MIPKIKRLSRVYELQGFPYGLKHVAAPSWLLLSSKNRPWWLKALAYLKLSLGSSIYRVWKLIDTPYRAMWDTTYWGFLRVGTTFDIFQNLHILYLEYGVLVFLDTAYWILFPSWSLVKCRHIYAVSSLMDIVYWLLEQEPGMENDTIEDLEFAEGIDLRRDDVDKDEEPSAGSNWGSKRRRAGKEPESTSAPKEKTSKTTSKSTDGSKSQHKSTGESTHTEEPMHTDKDLEEPAHQEFDIGATEEQSDEETSQYPDCFQKLAKIPTPDRDWNKTLPAVHGPVQPWLSNLAREEGPPGPTFELIKGQQYHHDLRKLLPLIPNSRGRQVIPFDHFINNDLAYLFGGVSNRTYATSVIKTKTADYGYIKWIKDLVPNIIWSKVPVKESACDVYSKRRIIVVTKLQIIEWHGNKHLDWITIRRDDDKLYTFKEGDFKRFRLQDIEDMLIFLVQCKLTNLNVEDRLAFGVSLRMFTRSIVIQRRVEDLQLGIKNYQKKLNITKPDTYRSDLKCRDSYTVYSNPRGFIYQNKDKKNKLMLIDELHKFSDGTLDNVRTALNDRLKGIRMEYLPKTIWRQSDRERAKAMI
ncbi:hypothetical protein Tco_1003148 [Tanacetum coccineum]|uniref:Uncharacterized protein n=1 Tax=Tanacetum coccineum TaxID=301880 RepID=A0ABQ5F8M1_9ASTR